MASPLVAPASPAPTMPRAEGSGDERMEVLRENAAFMISFGKVIPCGKGYPHDWARCPFAHPTEGARRRDPQLHPHSGVACPRLKKEGRCELGDACPFAHSIFEYWLHPSRYRTQLCKDGSACRRWMCFFAHNMDQLRIPGSTPDVPSDEVMAVVAAAMAANTGAEQLAQAATCGTSPREPRGFGGAARPAAAAFPPSQRPSFEVLDAAMGRQSEPQALGQHAAQHSLGDAEVVRLVVRLLERGEISADKSAAILRQLLPPQTLDQLQGRLTGRDCCMYETQCYSNPLVTLPQSGLGGRPLAPGAGAPQSRGGSLDGLTGSANFGWAPPLASMRPGPPARLEAQHQCGAPGEPFHLCQLAALQGALGTNEPDTAYTAAGRLMGHSGLPAGMHQQAMLAPMAEQGLPVFAKSPQHSSSNTILAAAWDALASSSVATSPNRGSPPLGSPPGTSLLNSGGSSAGAVAQLLAMQSHSQRPVHARP